jgi:hypothetical protein
VKPTGKDRSRARVILAQIAGYEEREHGLDCDALDYLRQLARGERVGNVDQIWLDEREEEYKEKYPMNAERRKELAGNEAEVAEVKDALAEALAALRAGAPRPLVVSIVDAAKDRLEDLRADVESTNGDEAQAFDEMPENTKAGEQGQKSEAAQEAMEGALEGLTDAIGSLEDVITKFEKAAE